MNDLERGIWEDQEWENNPTGVSYVRGYHEGKLDGTRAERDRREQECLTLQRKNDRLRFDLENAMDALRECAEYLANFADVDLVGDPPEQVGNREMQLLVTVREALGEEGY